LVIVRAEFLHWTTETSSKTWYCHQPTPIHKLIGHRTSSALAVRHYRRRPYICTVYLGIRGSITFQIGHRSARRRRRCRPRNDRRQGAPPFADQIVRAYLERIGSARRISAIEKMLVNTYGATIADAMVAKMLTADKLTQMLKSGNLDAPGVPSFAGLPALANLPTGNWLSLLGRLNFIQPVLLGIRISDTSDPDGYAAINLHYEGLDWKLSGIELPKAILRDLAAASLPVK
jgi:hypothetical protein